MLLLMTFLERPTDDQALSKYQRDEWGKLTGETCVIELSGLAAHSSKVSRDRTRFLPERITTIRERMLHFKPDLVVMYGMGEKLHFEEIIQRRFAPENVLALGPTRAALAYHPASWGDRASDRYFEDLGKALRRLRSVGEGVKDEETLAVPHFEN
jgi:hypothetical protein